MENPTYHIRISDAKKIGKYVLLPGDRSRVERIAKYFENPVHVAKNREYFTITGEIAGERVSVMSTGMGGTCMAIAVEELRTLGVHTLIRVGSAGSFQKKLKMGEGVIVTGAVRDDGTSSSYVPEIYPAVSHHHVLRALEKAASIIEHRCHMGIVLSTDSYYGARFNCETAKMIELLKKANTLCVDMESSTLLTLGCVFGLRTGSILTIREEIGEDEKPVTQAGEIFEDGLEKCIQISIKALELIIEKDKLFKFD